MKKIKMFFILVLFFRSSIAMQQSSSGSAIINIRKKKRILISYSLDALNPRLTEQFVIGEGGSGKILTTKYSKYVAKTSSSSSYNHFLYNEFEILHKLYEDFYNYADDYMPFLIDNITIPEPIYKEKVSIVEGERDTSPRLTIGMDKLFPIEKEKNVLTQIYLGRDNYDLLQINKEIDIIKGHIIGYNQIKETLKKQSHFSSRLRLKTNLRKLNNIKSLCFNLGCLMAIIHYITQYDGMDTEIFLVKENSQEKRIKITILDFGLCRDISANLVEKPQKAISKIIKSMTVEPSFPNPNQKGFAKFRNGYIHTATNLDFENIAIAVIDGFIKEQFIQKILCPLYIKKYLNVKPRKILLIKKMSKNFAEKNGDELLEYIIRKNYHVSLKKTIKLIHKIYSEQK